MSDTGVSNAIINVNANTAGATSSIKALSAEIVALNTAVRDLATAQNSALFKGAGAGNALLRGLREAYKGAAISQVELTSATDNFGKALDQGRLRLKDYVRYGQLWNKTSKQMISNLAVQQAQLRKAKVFDLGFDPVTGKRSAAVIQQAATAQGLLNERASIYRGLVKGASTEVINLGKNTQWAGRQLTVGLTVPLTIFAGLASKVFIDTEKQLTRLKRVYGDVFTSTSETDQMITKVKQLNQEFASLYGISTQATSALAADFAAAGLQGERLVQAVKATTKLQVLGEVDQKSAFDATLALTSAFKLSNKELGDSVNFLNAVENQTSTSIEDLVEAIPKAGPVIRTLGGDVRDLAVLLTAMREGAIDAGEGANAIKSGLARIVNPSKKVSEDMAALGIDIDTVAKKSTTDLVGSLQELGLQLDSLSKDQKAKAITAIFGRYQQSRITSILENITDVNSQAAQTLKITEQSADQLAGLAYKELQTQINSLPGQLQRAWQSVQAALLPIGEAFVQFIIPAIKMAANAITFFVEAFEGLSPGLKTLVKFAGIGVVIAGPIIMVAGVVLNLVGYLGKAAGVAWQLFRVLSGQKWANPFNMLTPDIIAANSEMYRSSEAMKLVTNSMQQQTAATEIATASLLEYRAALSAIAREAQALSYSTPAATRATLGSAAAGKGPMPIRRASGGWVPGQGDKDTIPAMLTPGEYVLNKKATAKFGTYFLDGLNSGRIKGFNKGGDPTKPPTTRINFDDAATTAGTMPVYTNQAFLQNADLNSKVQNIRVNEMILPEGESYRFTPMAHMTASEAFGTSFNSTTKMTDSMERFLKDFEKLNRSMYDDFRMQSVALANQNKALYSTMSPQAASAHFGEAQTGILANIAKENAKAFDEILEKHNITGEHAERARRGFMGSYGGAYPTTFQTTTSSGRTTRRAIMSAKSVPNDGSRMGKVRGLFGKPIQSYNDLRRKGLSANEGFMQTLALLGGRVEDIENRQLGHFQPTSTTVMTREQMGRMPGYWSAETGYDEPRLSKDADRFVKTGNAVIEDTSKAVERGAEKGAERGAERGSKKGSKTGSKDGVSKAFGGRLPSSAATAGVKNVIAGQAAAAAKLGPAPGSIGELRGMLTPGGAMAIPTAPVGRTANLSTLGLSPMGAPIAISPMGTPSGPSTPMQQITRGGVSAPVGVSSAVIDRSQVPGVGVAGVRGAIDASNRQLPTGVVALRGAAFDDAKVAAQRERLLAAEKARVNSVKELTKEEKKATAQKKEELRQKRRSAMRSPMAGGLAGMALMTMGPKAGIPENLAMLGGMALMMGGFGPLAVGIGAVTAAIVGAKYYTSKWAAEIHKLSEEQAQSYAQYTELQKSFGLEPKGWDVTAMFDSGGAPMELTESQIDVVRKDLAGVIKEFKSASRFDEIKPGAMSGRVSQIDQGLLMAATAAARGANPTASGIAIGDNNLDRSVLTLYSNLISQGFADDQAKKIIEAIAAEAGKREVVLNVIANFEKFGTLPKNAAEANRFLVDSLTNASNTLENQVLGLSGQEIMSRTDTGPWYKKGRSIGRDLPYSIAGPTPAEGGGIRGAVGRFGLSTGLTDLSQKIPASILDKAASVIPFISPVLGILGGDVPLRGAAEAKRRRDEGPVNLQIIPEQLEAFVMKMNSVTDAIYQNFESSPMASYNTMQDMLGENGPFARLARPQQDEVANKSMDALITKIGETNEGMAAEMTMRRNEMNQNGASPLEIARELNNMVAAQKMGLDYTNPEVVANVSVVVQWRTVEMFYEQQQQLENDALESAANDAIQTITAASEEKREALQDNIDMREKKIKQIQREQELQGEADDAAIKAIEEQNEKLQDYLDKKKEGWDAEREALQDKKDALQDDIDKINEQRDATLDLLDAQEKAESFAEQQRRSKIDLATAIAGGDMAEAARIQADMDANESAYNKEQARDSINDAADKRIDNINKIMDSYDAKIEHINELEDALTERIQKQIDLNNDKIKGIRDAAEARALAAKKEIRALNDANEADKRRQAQIAKTASEATAAISKIVKSGASFDEKLTDINKVLTDTKGLANIIDSKKVMQNFGQAVFDQVSKSLPSILSALGITSDGEIDYGAQMWNQERLRLQKSFAAAGVTVRHGGGMIGDRGGRSMSAGLYSDEVPALLQRGEYVISKKAVDHIGIDQLNSMNAGVYHGGGIVAAAAGTAAGGGIGFMQNTLAAGLATGQRMSGVIGSQIKQAYETGKLAQRYAGLAQPATDGSANNGDFANATYNGKIGSVGGALNFLQRQVESGATAWKQLCERLARTAYGLPGIFPSAKAHWNSIPAQYKHYGSAGNAPAGSLGFWNTGPYGHVAVSAGRGNFYTNLSDGSVGLRSASHLNTWGPVQGVTEPWWGKNAWIDLPSLNVGGQIMKDNVLANLHNGEVVLTKPLARDLQNGISSMGQSTRRDGAGGINNRSETWNINIDGKDEKTSREIIAGVMREVEKRDRLNRGRKII